MKAPYEKLIALAGNPNVGKSTVFNALTGMRQHTGNWPGKTVKLAKGTVRRGDTLFHLVDLPGCYSLLSHSREEETARDFICREAPDAVLVVCDATCLERCLYLALQILAVTPDVVLCVNLLDEAEKKRIHVDLDRLSKELGIPVVGTSARKKEGLEQIISALARLERNTYENDEDNAHKKPEICNPQKVLPAAEIFVRRAEDICKKAVRFQNPGYDRKDRRLDHIFTSRRTGFPIMFLLLLFVFWLTISGANLPSSLLSEGLFHIEDMLAKLAVSLHIPALIYKPLIFGVYRMLAWVISVMLPPMAIFFPLFTLLEDFGYLPRIAFNLDRFFQKCRACGKQALTMCMGFGCNAVGVTGCNIIDSPRERLLAILTNSFVPCNGRFPTIIAIISMFLAGNASGPLSSLPAAFLLALVILLGVGMTLFISRLLSATVLKGFPSSFVLELPPYRTPQIGTVIVRSVLDRTLFVLGRAVKIAAPAGLLIWLMANVMVGNTTLLQHCTETLDPFARLFGLDGVILMAFILGMPANEIVVPVMLMAYLSKGSLVEIENLSALKQLLTDNGWTFITAVSTIFFSLMHWPCGTTCLTVHKETGSVKWTLAAMLIPTLSGLCICFLFANTARLITGL